MNAEVRLYFIGRLDWDTEYFKATCPTDLAAKAEEIAMTKKAHHFNFGLATPEETYVSRDHRGKKIAISSDVKTQVEIIEKFVGLGERESRKGS